MQSKLDKNHYAPIIIVRKDWKALNRVRKCAKVHRHEFHVFEHETSYACISPRLVSRRRLEKMLRFCKSKNLNRFLMTGRTFIRTGRSVVKHEGEKARTLSDIPKKVCSFGIRSPGLYSKKHLDYCAGVSELLGEGTILNKWKARTKVPLVMERTRVIA